MQHIIKFILIGLFFLGCDGSDRSSDAFVEAKTLSIGETIELESIYGKKITFKKVDGGFVVDGDENKIIVFDIFGTFCEPCKKEAPALMNLQKNYSENIILVGLSYFEDVNAEYIKTKFAIPYNAHYFIAPNSPKNKILVDTITHDIDYKTIISLPFKVIIKNGSYQTLSDVWEGRDNVKFYIGEIATSIILSDINKIIGADKKFSK